MAIRSASDQGSVSFSGSDRPDLAGLLQGLLQDDGGRPAVEAVVAEEEDYEEEYGEEEQDTDGEEFEEDCKNWREGQGVAGETVARVCLDPILIEDKPPVAASTVEQDLEGDDLNGEEEKADDNELKANVTSCVQRGTANLGHNLVVQHGVPTPRLCALFCQVGFNLGSYCVLVESIILTGNRSPDTSSLSLLESSSVTSPHPLGQQMLREGNYRPMNSILNDSRRTNLSPGDGVAPLSGPPWLHRWSKR